MTTLCRVSFGESPGDRCVLDVLRKESSGTPLAYPAIGMGRAVYPLRTEGTSHCDLLPPTVKGLKDLGHSLCR